MNFQNLKDALGRTGTMVTIGTDTLPQPFADFLGTYYTRQGKQICVDNAEVTLDEAGRTIKIAGRADFFPAVNLPVVATFSLDDQGNVGAVLIYTLLDPAAAMNAWKFSTSFPGIPAADTPVKTGDAAPVPLLDTLSLLNAHLIVSSGAYTDPATSVALGDGISFVGQLRPTGVIGVLDGVLTGATTLPLYGKIRIPVDETAISVPILAKDLGATRTYPWDLDPALPGILLEAPLGAELSVGKLKLRQARFRIYSPLSSDWLFDDVFLPITAVTAQLDIPSAGITIDTIMTAEVGKRSSSAFVEARCQGLSIGNLAHLADLSGPSDLSATLPDSLAGPLKALAKLSLTDLAFSLYTGSQGLALSWLGITIGAPGCRWRVWGDHVEVTDLGLRLSVVDPLGLGGSTSLHTDVFGTAEIEGVPVQIKAAKDGSNFLLAASLKQKQTLPLNQLMKAYLPGIPAPAGLTVDALRASIDSSGLRLAGALLQGPDSWQLDLGPGKLQISDVEFDFGIPTSGTPLGVYHGKIGFGKDVSLAMTQFIPGALLIRAVCPKLSLSHMLATLTNQQVALPAGFDLILLDSTIRIEEQSGKLRFQLATQVKGLGCFAFEASNLGGSTWGFAAGLDLGMTQSSTLPGLAAIATFERLVHLEKLALVVASYDNAAFQFPDLAQFQNPLIGTGKVALPAQSAGLHAGLNLFADWRLDTKDKTQGLLAKLLGLNSTLGVTLQIGKDTARLFVRHDAKVMGHPLSCELGLMSTFGAAAPPVPSWFLTGDFTVNIQGNPQIFSVTTAFVPTGALLSATMKGSAPVDLKLFKLSNLALEIGVDLAGLPSLGIAGTIDVKNFESSVAIFFDSTDPARSLVAGSLSQLTLKDVAQTLLGSVVPSSIDEVLAKIQVKGTQQFQMAGDLAQDLDKRDVAKIAAAIRAAGKVELPSSADQVFLCVNKPGSAWHLTDLTKMRHYALVKTGNNIQVSVEAQFYFAPQPTAIGTIKFPQGYYLNAALDIYGFAASATIEISANKGIAVDAQLDKLVVGDEQVFCLAAAQGPGGPKLSIATFTQPNQTTAEFRPPHFYINGSVTLLGITTSVFASVSTKGIDLEIKGQLAPGVTFDLDVEFGGSALAVDGDFKVGIGTIDLGALGKIKVNTDLEGNLGVRVSGKQVSAAGEASFEFMGAKVNISHFALSTTPHALADLGKTMEAAVTQELQKIFSDASRWTSALKSGAIEGVTDSEKVLKDVYKKSDQEAKAMAKDVSHVATDVGKTVSKGASSFGKKIKKLF